jgi:hypothetical protein
MILAKARLIRGTESRLRVGLSFPTGFDPEEVIRESVRANGSIEPDQIHFDPRQGIPSDIYREFEVSFSAEDLASIQEQGAVKITGRFKRGIPFSATIPAVRPSRETDH